jgi:hypothetical protein
MCGEAVRGGDEGGGIVSDDYIVDLADAIIEDTVHCQCCGCSWTLGGNDGLIVEVEQGGRHSDECARMKHIGQPEYKCDCGFVPTVAQLVLCIECAARVHAEYEEACKEAGICEDCNKAYKEAAKQYGGS